MAKHTETGKFGEDLATEFLIKKGYKILERNYRHRRSEIDIIAEFNNEIIFVEVKTRYEIILLSLNMLRTKSNISKQPLLPDFIIF